ncbi:MAG: ATPase [Spirochaetes bacterium]|nr:MAG: ATPase [Spirochaetota bacterium]
MIYRDILDQIRPWLKMDKVVIIKGARQVGKTTILKHLAQEIEAEGRPARYIAADLDFADPSFGDPRLFILRLKDLFGGKPGTVLIDEFQTIPRCGSFLKAVYDQTKEQYRFVVSGSSSLELAKNAEYLTGRKREFLLRPFSFREFLRSRLPEIPLPHFSPSEIKAMEDYSALYGQGLKAAYAEYLAWGGYPEVVLSPPQMRKEILKELLSTYIHKDVAGFQRVENISGFNNMVRVLGSQIGGQVNKSELGATLRLNAETVNRYLDILEGTYVFSLLPPWFSNPRKEVSKMPKAYVNDPGILISSGASWGGLDGLGAEPAYHLLDGHRVENAIWSTQSARGKEIRYWRTSGGAEVDFIVLDDQGPLPIEVKFTASSPTQPVAMKNFRSAYPRAQPGIVVSRDTLKHEETFIVPAYLFEFVVN